MKALTLLIPLLSFLLVCLLLNGRLRLSIRESFLASSLLFGALIVAMTELLSLVGQLTFFGILLIWTCVLITSIVLVYRYMPEFSLRDIFKRIQADRWTIVVLSLLGVYLLIIALIAIIAPPNTTDSLEYHMPKVAHWIQNQSVAFFPTDNPRQNHQNPGAEFLILQLQLLSGSDRFANLVSVFCMVGSLIGASLIAKILGAGRWGQVLSLVLVITLPMGIMQASSTQTDYVAAFWMICLAVFVLNTTLTGGLSKVKLLFISLAAGLGILTKATVYIYALPFMLWFVVILFRKKGVRAIPTLFLMGLLVLLVNCGHSSRNYKLHGSPLGPGEEPMRNTKYANELYTSRTLISNLVRNTTIHTNFPWEGPRNRLDSAVVKFHRVLGISENEPATTWGSFARFRVNGITFNDEIDGNPVHLLVVLFCLILTFSSRKLKKTPGLIPYAFIICLTFMLFSFMLKWNPWHSRLHLSQFVIAAPFCAVVLSATFRKNTLVLISVILLFLHVPWLLKCEQRPILAEKNIFSSSRFELYFSHHRRQNQMEMYRNSWEYIRSQGFENVGMITNPFACEYIFWAMKYEDTRDVRIENVAVRNISGELPYPGKDFLPDAVLSLVRQREDKLVIDEIGYKKVWSERRFSVFVPTNKAE